MKAREFGRWLERRTEGEWEEMGGVRRRLEKLEAEKKKLIESQREGHLNQTHKVFRMRSLFKKKEVGNVSMFNPET